MAEKFNLEVRPKKTSDVTQREEIKQLKNTLKFLSAEFEKEKSKRKKSEREKSAMSESVLVAQTALEEAKELENRAKLELELAKARISSSPECQICFGGESDRALSCGHLFCASCAIRFYQEQKCPNCLQKVLGIQQIFFI